MKNCIFATSFKYGYYGEGYSMYTWTVSGRCVCLTVLLGAWLMVGCEAQVQEKKDAQKAYQQQAVATINGEKIYFDSFQDAYQRLLTRWARFIQEDNAEELKVLKQLLLQRMIDETLLDQEARRQGVYVSGKDAESQAKALLKSQGKSKPQAASAFATVSAKHPNWTHTLRKRAMYIKLIEQEVIQHIHLSADEIRDYYRKNIQKFQYPPQVRAWHMCLKTRKLHDEVWQKLSRAANFAKLAKRYSCTPDGARGGDLGYHPKGVLPPDFEKVIFNLHTIGELSSRKTPLQNPMGYHIFMYGGRKNAYTLSLKQAEPEIRRILRQHKQTDAYHQWLANLRLRAAIHINETLLNAA